MSRSLTKEQRKSSSCWAIKRREVQRERKREYVPSQDAAEKPPRKYNNKSRWLPHSEIEVL